ncbi:MAG: hypothetical protein ACOCQX_01770 [Candidatus Nanoarchaeia archaeon]
MSLEIIFQYTVFVLVGIVLVLFSRRLRLPGELLLIGFGLFLGYLKEMTGAFQISAVYIKPIVVIALVAFVFSSFLKINPSSFDHLSKLAQRHLITLVCLSVCVLGFSYWYLSGDLKGALLFPFVMLPVYFRPFFQREKYHRKKVLALLQKEQKLIAPIALLLPFILVNAFYDVGQGIFKVFASPVLGLCVGVLLGVVFMRIHHLKSITYPLVFGFSLIAYVLAVFMNGSGVVAAGSFALFYAGFHVRERKEVMRFSEQIADTLGVIVLIVLGYIIYPLSLYVLGISFGFFLLILLMRFASVVFSELYWKEKLYIALDCRKQALTGTVLLAIVTLFHDFFILVQVAAIIVIYSACTGFLVKQFMYRGDDI